MSGSDTSSSAFLAGRSSTSEVRDGDTRARGAGLSAGAPLSIVAVILLTASAVTAAGQQPGSRPPSCSEIPEYSTLDFWVGEWDVYVGEQRVGRNVIEKTLGGCAVLEHWTDARGGRGQSLFYFSPAFDGWRQVWVTETAAMRGGVKEKRQVPVDSEGAVRFQGTIPLPDGSGYLDRTTLTPLPSGEVRQHIEISHDEGDTWQTTFDAIYRAPSDSVPDGPATRGRRFRGPMDAGRRSSYTPVDRLADRLTGRRPLRPPGSSEIEGTPMRTRTQVHPRGSALAAIVVLAGAPSLAFGVSTDVPEQVTFAEHVAPIFYSHCIDCHRPGDVAPMSLLTFEEARPWAKSIQRVVDAGEMPPWDADPRYGEFANDISLSPQQIEIVKRWVQQGARPGDLAAMPELPPVPPPGSWRMGREPDVVVELAAVEVPGDGPDLFYSQVVGLEIPPGKWVQAIELLPGNTQVLHHVVTYLGPFGISDEEETSNAGVFKTIYLNEAAKRPIGMAEAPSVGAVWVAGSPPTQFPEGMGHPLDEKQLVSLNMHYHPSGAPGTDRSKLGFYFGEGEMEKEITTAFAADPGLLIPAGAERHREVATYLFSQDGKILSLLPHMHQRGRSMKYTLHRTDGSSEVLLDVPEYDYDWQNIYRFAEPVSVEAGAWLEVEAVWNNSPSNPANPDPGIDVRWGDGTDHEMLVAFFDFVVDEGKKPRPVRGDEKIAALLARHAPERSYALRIDGMGFGGPMGLVLPTPTGADGGEAEEGRFYVTFGSLMFSTSLPDPFRAGDDLVLNAAMITSGGGTRMPLGLLARHTEDGGLTGEIFFGRELTPDNLDQLRGQGRGFVGTRVSPSAAATSAGR